MPDPSVVLWIREKYSAVVEHLDERGRRIWAAAEARSLGYGGISAVAVATGMSDRTIRTGITELHDPNPLPSDRQRKLGGGRKARQTEQPGLLAALDALVDPGTRGDPESPLRWTCKSTYTLAQQLQSEGFSISASTVGSLLKQQGYSLQANRKTSQGGQHPDRNEQFEFIARRAKTRQRAGEPVISVDTKKKEILGNHANSGRIYRPTGNPIKVDTHDFPDPTLGKAIPYGVYDIQYNEAAVSVGTSADTAEFAVTAIRTWWEEMGQERHGNPRRIMVTADCGGSNGPNNRLWKHSLQVLADQTGIIFEVCHYPPGTSKWNKIEHRLFCHITSNWRGVPLENLEIVVNLIGSTRTNQGLEVHAWLNQTTYETGKKISNEEFSAINIKCNKFHGDWNYEIHPRII